jgi:hypothetical protein
VASELVEDGEWGAIETVEANASDFRVDRSHARDLVVRR